MDNLTHIIKRYPECKNIKAKPDIKLNKELKESLAKNYDVLPLFEKTLSDRAFMRKRSLQVDDVLACKWKSFKDNFGSRVHGPFQFPRVNDIHFYNNQTCYKPSLSIDNRGSARFHLYPGPGVDSRGQVPIPSDMGYWHSQKARNQSAILKKRRY